MMNSEEKFKEITESIQEMPDYSRHMVSILVFGRSWSEIIPYIE